MGKQIDRVMSRVRRLRRAWRLRDWERRSRSAKYVRRALGGGLFVDMPSASDFAKLIYVHDYEAGELEVLRHLLRPGDFVLDVGANFGIYSVLAAGIVGSTGRVWAFEPSSGTFASLQHNISANHLVNVLAHHVALSDADGEGMLKVSLKGRDAWNTLGASLHGSDHEFEAVRCARLDSFFAGQAPSASPAMFKLDVEGWEWHVLRGAEQLLARKDAPMLQVEFAPAYSEANGESIEMLRDEILRHGYTLFTLSDAGTLLPWNGTVEQLAGNLYAVKRDGPWGSRIQA
jgi:FkbM family methyltransferase